MESLVSLVLNGLDKGAAYALIALGLTLIFGTLGVVNFAHGALFMLGAFCAVTMRALLTFSKRVRDDSITFFEAYKEVPYLEIWFPEWGATIIDYSLPISIILAIPLMALVGWAMERGLIRHFYNRPHSDQILVTFALAIILSEIVRALYGANPIQTPSPAIVSESAAVGSWIGLGDNVVYPWWRLVYLVFPFVLIGGVFALLQFTRFGMIIRAGMADQETVGLLGINIQRRFTITFALAAVVTGLAGLMYAPIVPPSFNFAMEYLVISFVVVVVGGMGSLAGAVLAGFLLGILQSLSAFLSSLEQQDALPAWMDLLVFRGLDQIIIFLVAIIVILVLPRGLMGRKGVMES